MSTGSRTPPRFVPTLTTVVDLSTAASQNDRVEEVAPPTSPNPAQSSPVAVPEPSARLPEHAAPNASAAFTEADAFRVEEELLHRILQRVDLSLEERLTEVVSAAVQQHLDTMLPQLRSEMESALRSLLVESLAQELSEHTGSTPG